MICPKNEWEHEVIEKINTVIRTNVRSVKLHDVLKQSVAPQLQGHFELLYESMIRNPENP
ncbi:MAG: hypothetical protein KKB70_04960 [Proteobacteria bacterium]|nr:hypothetical protein [Pseudomonadota bacterium]